MVITAENSDISEKQITYLWEPLPAVLQTISLLAESDYIHLRTIFLKPQISDFQKLRMIIIWNL